MADEVFNRENEGGVGHDSREESGIGASRRPSDIGVGGYAHASPSGELPPRGSPRFIKKIKKIKKRLDIRPPIM